MEVEQWKQGLADPDRPILLRPLHSRGVSYLEHVAAGESGESCACMSTAFQASRFTNDQHDQSGKSCVQWNWAPAILAASARGHE